MDRQECGLMQLWPNDGTTHSLYPENEENHQNPQTRTADVLAQIQTALVPNESRDHYSYICNDNIIKRFKSHWSSSKRQILSWSF